MTAFRWLAGLVVAADTVDLQLVLAVDVSGSVNEEEVILQRQGYVAALTSDAVIHAIIRGRQGRIALTYVEWAGNHFAEMIVGWTVIDGIDSAAAFANALLRAPLRTEMWTSISTAIDYGTAMFEFSPHSGGRRVIDISGDGANNSGDFVVTARDGAFFIVADGFKDFARAIRRKMILEIAGLTPPPEGRLRLAGAVGMRCRRKAHGGARRLLMHGE